MEEQKIKTPCQSRGSLNIPPQYKFTRKSNINNPLKGTIKGTIKAIVKGTIKTLVKGTIKTVIKN